MKKIIILYLLTVPFIFSQLRNNGNISLVFNKEKIDLPIHSVAISKENGIVLSITAEKRDSIVQQIVALNIGLKKLSAEPNAENLDDTKINIKSHHIKPESGKELSISFKDDESIDNKNKFETIHYGIYNKGERISWGITSVSLKIDITSLKYENENLHISGKFSGTFKSNAASDDQKAELENGEFNIIF